jgi:hypothetical protein
MGRGLEIGQYRLFLSPLAKIPFERHERYLCYALTFITFNKGISIAPRETLFPLKGGLGVKAVDHLRLFP